MQRGDMVYMSNLVGLVSMGDYGEVLDMEGPPAWRECVRVWHTLRSESGECVCGAVAAALFARCPASESYFRQYLRDSVLHSYNLH